MELGWLGGVLGDSHGRYNLEGCLGGVLGASHGRWNLEGCLGGVLGLATEVEGFLDCVLRL